MNAIQQKCRPKHQVLVLKCYPRTTKGAVDVKPNSSELSYLLFYAQSRRTKIQKVGSFLEKKTASDVYRQRIGNVQVTLQILTALIEKAPKDLPLYATNILKILEQILKSNDITMVESSLPTFEAFCENHDGTSLLADQAYLQQYVSVVRQYATLASTRTHPGKTQPSKPVWLRWRNSGLEAIRAVASADALSSVTGRQYDVVVPMILENLWTDNEDFLEVLLQRAQMEEKVEAGLQLKRRTSVATVRTAETGGDANTNPIALAGTALDVDKLAEEDIGVLAMQCLKQIFEIPNRSLIHAATVALLKFIKERVDQQEDVVKTNIKTGKDSGWAIKMFGLVARWAPVQDRYTILLTALETLHQTPLTDETIQHHIVVTAMIQALLQSDVNLIGLSIMDVLTQLIAHIRRLVQMPGDPNSMRSDPPGPGQPDPRSPTTIKVAEKAEWTAAQRKELLSRLQYGIGDLATHVYYADQISDMVSTILMKLKPSRSNSTASSSPQGEKADGTASGEDPHLDSLFSLTVAKTAALRAVKSILMVANPRQKTQDHMRLSRNKVPIQVWEGTHWLLRDPDGYVRKAYVDALLAWLDRETTPADLKARDETATHRSSMKHRELPAVTFARRAVSSASNRGEKPVKIPRSHFLQLLHLAIYDNALQYLDYETDIVLLHVLLGKLVNSLGVNAVRYGVPMIFRLQEDIQDAETPIAKVRLGSLVHGYFWVLTEKFDFEASVVGRAIHNEIIRRRSKHFWVEGVHIPPPLLELVGTPGMARPQPKLPFREIESEALLPFDDRVSLVECVCTAYQESASSPPASPTATSPGRSFTHPILSSTLSTIPTVDSEKEIPSQFREQMLTDWSRETVLAAVQAGSKSASLNGSRTGTTGTGPGQGSRLTVNGAASNGHARGGATSPYTSQGNLRPSSSPAPGPTNGQLSHAAKLRKSSVRSNASPRPGSTSSRGQAVTSVEQLKLVLSGHLQPPPTGTLYDDDSDDSLVSYDMTPSELSFNPAAVDTITVGHEQTGAEAMPRTVTVTLQRTPSIGGGPLSSHPTTEEVSDEEPETETVPPVPPLPSGFEGKASTIVAPPPQEQANTLPRPATSRRSIKSRGGADRALSSSWGAVSGDAPTMDLESLLKGIDSGLGEKSLAAVTRPPY
ncbi:hypothetical protein GQ53DRAFT_784706 [Thozetella sp. PMI_491]|nr:hypothetical protein GQ53DRAFT_784706 [Thozetella sp. PMI_491]